MGYMMLICECAACRRPISCNPEKVPSIRINGVREPICRACAERWSEIHNTPVSIHPDAYEPTEVF